MNSELKPKIRFRGFTDDWEQRKLSDNLKNIQTGTNLLGSINNLGTPLLKMGNIQRGYFTTDKLEYLKDYSSIEKENIANFGDFFFNTRNTLELVGKGATWFGISGKYAFNSNIARFTFEGINTTFFNYLYNTESLLKQVHSRATGTTSVAAIYPQSLNTIEYMLPSYDEQSKIGNLLLDLDNLITLHQRKCDKLIELKKSLLEKMFPQNNLAIPEIRFRGFTDDWEQRKFEEIIDLGSGKDYKHLNHGNIPVYGTGGYMLSVDKALSYTKDAIGIGRKGTIDKPYILKAPFWTVDTLFYAICRDFNDINFVYSLFQKISWKEKDESTGVPSLSKVTINNVTANVTNFEEQNKIGKIFSNIDTLITLHQRKHDKLKKIKQSLLNDMFV